MRLPLLAIALPLAIQAQEPKPGAITVKGTVMDAAAASPIQGATVVLTARDAAGVLPPRDGTPQLFASRAAKTGADGGYVFPDVAVGKYQLYIHRIGYQATTLALDLTDGSAVARVSIGLVEMPVQLRTQHIRSDSSDQFGRFTDPVVIDSGWRASVAMARQRRYLASDVRELTNGDAIDAGSTGETDILRAFRHVPGVTSPDDYSDELWVRGARWDQVRVYYDGLPLLDPRHYGGSLAAVSSDAVGAAFLHPGVRSVSNATQGATLIDLRSRAARSDSNLSGSGGLSMVGTSLSFDDRMSDGRLGLTVSGRRSLNDISRVPLLTPAGGDRHYSEIASRADLLLAKNVSLETSVLWTRDFSHFPRVSDEGVQGSTLASATLHASRGGWALAQTVGLSSYDATSADARYKLDTLSLAFRITAQSWASSHAATALASGVARRSDGAGGALAYGYDLQLESASFSTPMFALAPGDSSTALVRESSRLPTLSLWTERRWQPRSRLSLEAGLRGYVALEDSREPLRVAPSLLGSYDLSQTTRLTAGVSRSYQDVQLLTSINSRDLWRVGGKASPIMVADQALIGWEGWRGESMVLSLNGYARDLRHVVALPIPADTIEARASSLDRITTSTIRAYGVEAGVRKLAGRVTGSASYSIGRATSPLDGTTITAPGERRYTFDGALAVHSGRKRYGISVVTMSGVPYRRYLRVQTPDGSYAVADTTPYAPHYAPRFLSSTVFWDWTGHIRSVGITPYLTVQNVTGRANQTIYYGSCTGLSSAVGYTCYNNDLIFESGFRGFTTPINLGFRIVF